MNSFASVSDLAARKNTQLTQLSKNEENNSFVLTSLTVPKQDAKMLVAKAFESYVAKDDHKLSEQQLSSLKTAHITVGEYNGKRDIETTIEMIKLLKRCKKGQDFTIVIENKSDLTDQQLLIG